MRGAIPPHFHMPSQCGAQLSTGTTCYYTFSEISSGYRMSDRYVTHTAQQCVCLFVCLLWLSRQSAVTSLHSMTAFRVCLCNVGCTQDLICNSLFVVYF